MHAIAQFPNAPPGVMLLPMKPESCPFCASDDLDVIAVDQDGAMLAVSCKECGATGPLSLSDDPAHAIHSWDQRMGRLNSVKRQWQRL